MPLPIPTSQRGLRLTPRMPFWQPGWKFCCHKSKKFMFQVRIKGKLTKVSKNYFYIFIRNMILWRLRVQFSILIPLPKTFSPSTVNVRSEFWKIFWKKRIFKKLIFWLILWHEDCKFQFWFPLRNVFCQARYRLVQKSAVFEKKSEISNVVFHSNCSFGHVECSFNEQVKILPAIFGKSFSSSYLTSNTNISKRTHIDT